MSLEGIKDVEEKIIVLQNEIKKSKKEIDFDVLTSFLGRLRQHSKMGESFRYYLSLCEDNFVNENLDILNPYLIKSGKALLTEKDIEKIYNSFK